MTNHGWTDIDKHMVENNTFSKTLQQALQFIPENGELEGDCCMCGEHTSKGNKKKFGNNFTCADYLECGDVICPYCQHLVSNSNQYRRTMFLLTPSDFKKFKKKDIKNIIFNLPTSEDFYLYLTQTWQKLGYVLMNKARNTVGEEEVRVVIDYDIITYKKEDLKKLYDFVCKLRELKIPKEALIDDNIEVHHYRRIKEKYPDNPREIINTIIDHHGNPVWELAIYISD